MIVDSLGRLCVCCFIVVCCIMCEGAGLLWVLGIAVDCGAVGLVLVLVARAVSGCGWYVAFWFGNI